MLRFPAQLDPETFLREYWQKRALYLPQATGAQPPFITRNELAWLATLDDVESRIVFTERDATRTRYRAVAGPFDEAFLQALPKRNWSLLVHDVEKHLPNLRAFFALVPFIPDWRIDDLMVSFAAPGGGVGPHRDNYDVFLCQGTGVREWRVSDETVENDPGASDDLALLQTFEGNRYDNRSGDILYLPPGTAHWGTAKRACMTYSIGMRAPQASDLRSELSDDEQSNPFYQDPDLAREETRPGWISGRAAERACETLNAPRARRNEAANALGRFVTLTKNWLTPDAPDRSESQAMIERLVAGGSLRVHGMTRLAWDAQNVYANGASHALSETASTVVESMCANRVLAYPGDPDTTTIDLVAWLLTRGVLEIPENL